MKTMEMKVKIGMLPQRVQERIAASSPTYLYENSLKSPHSIYRWLAVWKI
jgi:hypothetical protein